MPATHQQYLRTFDHHGAHANDRRLGILSTHGVLLQRAMALKFILQ
jgi:hypothetical protein